MAYIKIDTSEALAQLGGSEKLYKTLVNGFYDKYQHVDQEIESLIKDGNLEDARRLAHSIKGLSGNLGAKVLREKAMNLEYAIRDESGEMLTNLDLFADELSDVISEVRHMLSNKYNDLAKPEITVTYGEDEFITASYELLSALETYRYSEVKIALEKFSQTKVLLRYQNEAKMVVHHVENYDYDQAIELLKDMVNR